MRKALGECYLPQSKAHKQRLAQKLYVPFIGEDIPPATLYLALGKPTISLDIIPPLLIGNIQCYWTQQPGYTLTEKQLRTILYDYAYLRRTWREEKLDRAKEALADRPAWEEGPILGLGMQLGPFWSIRANGFAGLANAIDCGIPGLL